MGDPQAALASLAELDVQGSQMTVLRGAGARIGDVRAVQTELSLTPLYNARSLVDWLAERGFSPAPVERAFDDPTSGRMLQIDGIFIADIPSYDASAA